MVITMDAIDMVYDCLQEKKTLFAEYEVCTNEMMTCDSDCFEHYITERGQLAIQIDKIAEEMESLCAQDDEPELIRNAANYKGNYEDYPEEMRDIYELAGQVFGSMNRVRSTEDLVEKRMQEVRGELLDKIRSKSDTAKVYHYVKGMAGNVQGSQGEQISYLGGKYGKI